MRSAVYNNIFVSSALIFLNPFSSPLVVKFTVPQLLFYAFNWSTIRNTGICFVFRVAVMGPFQPLTIIYPHPLPIPSHLSNLCIYYDLLPPLTPTHTLLSLSLWLWPHTQQFNNKRQLSGNLNIKSNGPYKNSNYKTSPSSSFTPPPHLPFLCLVIGGPNVLCCCCCCWLYDILVSPLSLYNYNHPRPALILPLRSPCHRDHCSCRMCHLRCAAVEN